MLRIDRPATKARYSILTKKTVLDGILIFFLDLIEGHFFRLFLRLKKEHVKMPKPLAESR